MNLLLGASYVVRLRSQNNAMKSQSSSETINQFSSVVLNLLYICQCHGSSFYCRL